MPNVTATGAKLEAGTETAAAPNHEVFNVSIDGVSKIYRTGGTAVQALDNVTLKVKPGEFVSLVGASGCGKSTLLNLVAGLDKPTAGTVTSVSRPALMFQEPALLPWLTAGKNVELALKYAGVPRQELRAKADELLEVVRLGGTAKRRVHELSGGQKQRVAMARALAQDSQVLLMDEPFAALDAITRDVLHDELVRIWTATGLTVIFVTHNVREAVRLGQRVVLFSSRPGRVVREWAVDIQGPRTIEHPLVGDLASDITVNLREEIARHGGHKAA
jgi:NitT/TauT family transport system ATP-binding protein